VLDRKGRGMEVRLTMQEGRRVPERSSMQSGTGDGTMNGSKVVGCE